MSTINEAVKRLVRRLIVSEKIFLAEDLRESIVAESTGISIPMSHKKELDRGLQQFVAAPGKLLTLKELCLIKSKS